MAEESPFAHLTNLELKLRALRVAHQVRRSSDSERDALLGQVAQLRDEMLLRLGSGGDDDGTSGVREPRRPMPGGGSATVIARPER